MRRILLAAVLLAVAALASAETVIWTGEVHVEKWVTDDTGASSTATGAGYSGNMPGVRQFEFDGRTYTGDLFYITNTPRSLLRRRRAAGFTGHPAADRPRSGVAGRYGQRFELADPDRSFPGRGVAAWTTPGSTGRTVRWCRCSSCRRRHRFRRCRSPAPSCSSSYCSSGGGDDDCRLPTAGG